MPRVGRPTLISRGWICSSCRSLRKPRLQANQYSYATVAPFRKPSQQLPNSPARTRFAPSPTGNLHLGSLRTALFSYLLAKATGGQFLLRIEDTDSKRTVPGAEEKLCADLQWAGLQWDEGPSVGGPYGPYRQSERTSIYRAHAEQLLESGHAYRCFCSSNRLHKLTTPGLSPHMTTIYDRTCLSIPRHEADERASSGEPNIVRLKEPDEQPLVDDLVYGSLAKKKGSVQGHPRFDDAVLIKSDGRPTYHLANVVDDHLMSITHVIRGVEWIPSTPNHLAIYQAFGWQAPRFAHVGLLQHHDRRKLSKRDQNFDLDTLKNSGIFPEALMNFVALLGWSHSLHDDRLNMQRLIEQFDLKFTKGNTIVNSQKLRYLQHSFAKKYTQERGAMFDSMVQQVVDLLHGKQAKDEKIFIPPGRSLKEYVVSVIEADSGNYYTPSQFIERNENFFLTKLNPENEISFTQDQMSMLHRARIRLSEVPEVEWKKDKIGAQIKETISDLAGEHTPIAKAVDHPIENIISKKLRPCLRSAIMGTKPGPPMSSVMEILGRDMTLSRLQRFE